MGFVSVDASFVNSFGFCRSLHFAHGWAIEIEPVGVVNEPIEDGVREGWFTDDLVPDIERKLAGDEGGTCTVAVLDDLHQVAALAGIQAIRPPVIKNEQIDFCQAAEQARKATIASMRSMALP